MLALIVRIYSQPVCPLAGPWIKKMWCNRRPCSCEDGWISSLAGKQMELEVTVESEREQVFSPQNNGGTFF